MTEIQKFESEFTFNAPIAIEESKTGKTIISGTLLSEGLSKNGNLYTVECLESLGNLSNIPIFLGTDSNNRHTKALQVGKILKTTFDKIKRKVTFIAEIFNQKVAETVAKGWGISIGGTANGAFVLDKLGRMLTHVKNLVLNHVQLLMPNTARGMDSAKVESVEVQETMMFSKNPPKLSRSQIVAILASMGEDWF
ncbi:MAG: hypothetical protein ACE14S_06910 [Candidatus Bathyarchaeia archaeon]